MNLRQTLLSTLTVYLLIIPTNQYCHCGQLRWLECTNIVDAIERDVCKDVTRIDITESSIHDLKYGLFKNYTNAIVIVMTGNNVTNIAKDAFNNLSQLSTLVLRNNFIRIIPEDTFNKLYNLRQLDLSKNNIVSAKPLLKDCGNIKEIDLSFNNISQIHLTQECTNLDRLTISGNHLTEFAINRTNSLTMLNLSGNNLNNINKVSLKNLDQLLFLFLSHNQLFHTYDVPVNLFQNKTSLIYLGLADTGIRNLTAGVFASLTNLRNLDLNSNHLEFLPENIFDGLDHLQDLDISNNRLTVWKVENYPRFLSINLNRNLWSCKTMLDIRNKYRSMGTSLVLNSTYVEITCMESGVNLGNNMVTNANKNRKNNSVRNKSQKWRFVSISSVVLLVNFLVY